MPEETVGVVQIKTMVPLQLKNESLIIFGLGENFKVYTWDIQNQEWIPYTT